MSDKDDKKTEQKVAEAQIKSAEPPVSATVPTGKEHWGKGGTYRKDATGKRIKVAQPKQTI